MRISINEKECAVSCSSLSSLRTEMIQPITSVLLWFNPSHCLFLSFDLMMGIDWPGGNQSLFLLVIRSYIILLHTHFPKSHTKKLFGGMFESRINGNIRDPNWTWVLTRLKHPIKCHWKALPRVTVISRIASFTLSDLPVWMVSTLAQFITAHVLEHVNTKQWSVRNIHRTSSTRMKYIESSNHLASSCIPSIDPLSPHEISDSVSLVDSEWWNLRDSIVLESMLSSKGQFASSKLSINRDTWAAHKSAVMMYKDERFWLTIKGKMKFVALIIRVSKGKISNNNNILG